jgi:hypothetical protein
LVFTPNSTFLTANSSFITNISICRKMWPVSIRYQWAKELTVISIKQLVLKGFGRHLFQYYTKIVFV